MKMLAPPLVLAAVLLSLEGPGAAAAQASSEPAEANPEGAHYAIELEAGVGVAVGLLPGPAAGGVLGILIQSPYFLAVEVVGSMYPFVAQDTSAGSAHWLAAFGGFLLCTNEASLGAFSLRGCAGGEVGFVHVRGAIDPPADYVTGQVLLRLRLSYRIAESITLWTRPTFGINTRTDAYVTDLGGTPNPLYAPEPVMALFDIGVGWVFD